MHACKLAVALLLLFASLICFAAGDLVTAFRFDRSEQGDAAVRLARQALEYACRRHEPLPLPDKLPPLLHERGAVFVSSMMNGTGAPRCCMGTLNPREATLAQEIIANAFAAAEHDTRFPPIPPTELRKLRVIVSVIGESRPISDPTTLDPLRDGLAVCGSRQTGVVLPGETDDVQKMIAWGRIRAGASAKERVQYLRLAAVRFMEGLPAQAADK
jgi:AMMECR1 domain-containing protein